MFVAVHNLNNPVFCPQTINDKFSQGDKKRELVQMMQEVLDEIQTDINDMDWSVDGETTRYLDNTTEDDMAIDRDRHRGVNERCR